VAEINDVMAAAVNVVKAAVPELNAYPRVVPTITLPAVVAYPPDEISYGDTFDDGGTMLFVLRLYVAQRGDGSDQTRLNEYISRDGARSVVQAIKDNPRLGGVVADARVVQAANYGNWPVGNVTHLGVELRIAAMLP
jgi:hypothetical protein